MGIRGVIQTCSIDTRCPNDAQRRILIGHGNKFQKFPSRLLAGGGKRDKVIFQLLYHVGLIFLFLFLKLVQMRNL